MSRPDHRPHFKYPQHEKMIDKAGARSLLEPCVLLEPRFSVQKRWIKEATTKFGGAPFLAPGETWPLDDKREQIPFLFQVNFAEIGLPSHLPAKGVLTVFWRPVDPDDPNDPRDVRSAFLFRDGPSSFEWNPDDEDEDAPPPEEPQGPSVVPMESHLEPDTIWAMPDDPPRALKDWNDVHGIPKATRLLGPRAHEDLEPGWRRLLTLESNTDSFDAWNCYIAVALVIRDADLRAGALERARLQELRWY